MRPCVCVEMLFADLPFEERMRRAAAAGFGAVEFWSWKDKDIPSVAAAARETGVAIANFSGHRAGDLVDPARHDEVLADFLSALEAARALGCPTLMLLAQELGEGGRVVRGRASEAGPSEVSAIAAGARLLLGRLPEGEGPSIGLEPLNTVRDHPGYCVSRVATAARAVAEAGDPRFGLVLDLYHQAMMGDDTAALVREYAPMIKHVHVADAPGRHEPGTGRVDWIETLGALGDAGYEGYVGFELSPAGSDEAALEAISRLWRELEGR